VRSVFVIYPKSLGSGNTPTYYAVVKCQAIFPAPEPHPPAHISAGIFSSRFFTHVWRFRFVFMPLRPCEIVRSKAHSSLNLTFVRFVTRMSTLRTPERRATVMLARYINIFRWQQSPLRRAVICHYVET
jgi:hypothetical protein